MSRRLARNRSRLQWYVYQHIEDGSFKNKHTNHKQSTNLYTLLVLIINGREKLVCFELQPNLFQHYPFFLEINNSCPKTYSDGIWWDRIPPGGTRMKRCPFNAVGNVTRYCNPRTSWDPPKFFDCTSQLFAIVQSMVIWCSYFIYIILTRKS